MNVENKLKGVNILGYYFYYVKKEKWKAYLFDAIMTALLLYLMNEGVIH